jgi:hypothetical protein
MNTTAKLISAHPSSTTRILLLAIRQAQSISMVTFQYLTAYFQMLLAKQAILLFPTQAMAAR